MHEHDADAAWASLDLAQPIISAPMAGVSGGALASAVMDAGGLGLVAVGHGATAAYIEKEVGLAATAASASAAGSASTSASTSATAAGPGSWGVGLMAWSQALEDYAALRAVLEYEPPVVALSAGDPLPGAVIAKDAGAVVAVQVGTAAEVEIALAHPAIDLVVVRGAEAGGHGLNAVATLPLLQYALRAASRHDAAASRASVPRPKPIAAAGGIATAAGLAAVLAAGARAAWIGTAFIPTAESLSAPALRDAVAAARLEDTVYTSVFDIALGLPWPVEYGGRALRNDVAARWAGRQASLREGIEMADAEALAVRARVTAARGQGDPTAAPVYAGQGAGLLSPGRPATVADGSGANPGASTAWPSAADVVRDLAGARELLRAAADSWG